MQGAQHERRVPDPGVAVVPVAGPARCLGQRGGGSRHDGPGGGVAEALEGQGAALDVAAPRVIGEGGRRQPIPPVGHGVVQLRLGLLHRGGRPASPGQGHEGALALIQVGAAVAAGPGHPQAQTRGHRQRRVARRRVHGHGAVALAVVVPGPGQRAVLEQRHRVDQHLHPALDAVGQAQQGARGGRVPRGAAIVGPALLGLHRADHQQVLDDQPAGRGVPGGLEHHGPGQVAALLRHVGGRGPEAEQAGRAVQDGPEHAR